MMTIEDRLENVERELGRQKRRNRWLLAAILLLVGGLVADGAFKTTANLARAQGAGTTKEVRAKNFVLEDENGMPRVKLEIFEDTPRLALYDKNLKLRADLSTSPVGPSLNLYDGHFHSRVWLSVDIDGPTMMLLDENYKVIWRAIK